jgi:hypothetical protein
MLHDDKDSELIGNGTRLRPDRLVPRGTGHGSA